MFVVRRGRRGVSSAGSTLGGQHLPRNTGRTRRFGGRTAAGIVGHGATASFEIDRFLKTVVWRQGRHAGFELIVIAIPGSTGSRSGRRCVVRYLRSLRRPLVEGEALKFSQTSCRAGFVMVIA